MSDRVITIKVVDSNSDGEIIEEAEVSFISQLSSIRVDPSQTAAALLSVAKTYGLDRGNFSEPTVKR